MGRRKNTTAAEDIFNLGRRIPIIVSVLLAATFYFGSELFITIQFPPEAISSTPTDIKQPGYLVNQALLTNAPFFIRLVFQMILPGLLLFGAFARIIEILFAKLTLKKVRSQANPQTVIALVDSPSTGKKHSSRPFDGISWRQFEQLTSAYFRERGYIGYVTEDGPDGGIDLRLRKDGFTYLVQCKHWRSQKVSAAVVRELFGVMTAEGAAGCFVVASGDFTLDAKEFVRGKNIILVTGDDIMRTPERIEPIITSVEQESKPSVACPKCGNAMVLRTARQGSHVGTKFWGCSQFPRCRGVMAAITQ